jgi:UDP-N-acetylglucosamine 4,6-dehydratase
MFDNKILLITGGTGSFGKQVLKRFLETKVKEIRIFSRDEKKQEEMRLELNNPKLKFYVGDVRDEKSVNQSMQGVNYIFHAAALKQVPSCEFYPREALLTNILGAENVMQSAMDNGVEKVIVLSTDKAVYPINAMGISKAMMEKFMVAKARMQAESGTIFCATRYGNVMASRGSVIPLFVDQIKSAKPLTVTDLNMTRFLMSLDESVDLVLHAFDHAKQGDIFVQKSPAATLNNLIIALKDIFQSKNEVRVIGTRHGEKLYETLVSREEMARAHEGDRYYRVPADGRDLNYNIYFSQGEELISQANDYTSHNTQLLDVESVKQVLLKLDYIRDQLRK